MPLVRYCTGDRGRFLAEPCPCGTRLRRLERVRARFSGRVPLQAGGTVDQATVDEALFALSPCSTSAPPCGATVASTSSTSRSSRRAPAPASRAGCEPALETAPGLAAAAASGRLRVDVAIGSAPWPQGVGTAKRTLVESRH